MTREEDYRIKRRLIEAQAATRDIEAVKAELAGCSQSLETTKARLDAAQQQLNDLQRHPVLRVWRLLREAQRHPAQMLRWPGLAAGLLKRRLRRKAAALPSEHAELLVPAQHSVAIGLGGEVLGLRRASDAPDNLQVLRLALIADRFTSESLAMECKTCDLRPDSWQDQMLQFMPHIVLVESAWQGVDGEWNGKISEPDAQLCSLAMSCRDAGIPCVFWNKEDPLHFEAFLRTAALFDHVFTTDAAAVAPYRQRLGHDRVTCLPFAVQPRLHHPFLSPGEKRREASFFAGAWYPHLQERCRDFRELADALEMAGPLVIHDRNGIGGGNNYPPAYASLIRAAVPYEETGTLYRGYRIGLTLNTIKQSPTMFARRAFELACTNTSVYSNYSQGLAMLMGDLVRMTDDGLAMFAWAWDELHAPNATIHRQRRLRALRKVVAEHTWQSRLRALVEQVLGTELPPDQLPVAILAAPGTQAELDRLLAMYRAQTQPARLWIVDCAGLDVPEGVEKLSAQQLQCSPTVVFPGHLVALWHPQDGYGPDYLSDLVAARQFCQGQIIGKGCYRDMCGQTTDWICEEREYRFVDSLAWRRSVAPSDCWTSSLAEIIAKCDEGAFIGDGLLSTDRESYVCRGDCQPLEDGANTGVSQQEVAEGLSRMLASVQSAPPPILSAAALQQLLSPVPPGISLALKAGSLELVSKLAPGTVERLTTPWHPVAMFTGDAGRVSLRLLAESSSRYTLLLEAADGLGNRLYSWPFSSYTRLCLPKDARIHVCRLVLEVRGEQVTYLSGVADGDAAEPLLMPGHGRLLVVTNGYPRRSDLYRNGFVHRRVKLYQQRGIAVDVVWVSDQFPRHSYEYDGVFVQVCDAPTLGVTLRHSQHRAMAVHFLDQEMWAAVQGVAARMPTGVWIHGAEAQRWQRRAFLYKTAEEQAMAKEQSEERMSFWRGVVTSMPDSMNLVFVSRTQADEVQQDLGIVLPANRWTVIHNPIDTGLFDYAVKSPQMRRNVLSIRPHASRVYANDLVAAAIHELAGRDGFDQLTFTLVGDGPLWEEDFASLAAYPNVRLQRGFVSHDEVKRLHDGHGVFLVPSRADTHGVSRDEAMSSGLVPITTEAGAVREFVDESCAKVVKAEDVEMIADALICLVEHPSEFSRMSQQAALRVRSQSSAAITLEYELGLLGFIPGPASAA